MVENNIYMDILDNNIKALRDEIIISTHKLYALKIRSQFDESKYYNDFVTIYNELAKLQYGLETLIKLQYDYVKAGRRNEKNNI